MRLRSDMCGCLTLPFAARYPGACSLAAGVYGRETYVWGFRRGSAGDGLASEEAHTARAGRRLGPGSGGLGRARRQTLGEGEDVLRDLAFAVTDNEWNPAVHRQYQSAAVRDDGVRDLAAEARFDVRGLDAAGAVVTVRDEL